MVQINGNKFATSQILKKKPVEALKGRILAGWAQKSPEPWSILLQERHIQLQPSST